MNEQPNPTNGEGDEQAQASPELSARERRLAVNPQPPGRERRLFAHRARPLRTGPANEPFAATDREANAAGGGLSGYLHAYRRRWFLATSLGLLCGAAATATAWFLATTSYTSSALIRIAADDQGIVYQDDKTHSSFDLYKGTQMQLLTSDFVLIAALRNPAIANLELLKQEDDPVRWLAKNLVVESPGNAEILRVGLTGPDQNGVAAIVQAVVDAYKTEVVDKERIGRVERLAELDRVYAEQETELRSKRTELKKLAGQLGSGDKSALSVKEQFELQLYTEARTELNRLRLELRRVQYALDDNKAKLAAVKAGRARPATAGDVEMAVINDPESTRLQQALAALDDATGDEKSTVKDDGPLARTLSDRYAKMQKSLEDQLASRRKRLAAHLSTVKTGDTDSLEAEAQTLQSQADQLAQAVQQAASEVEVQKKQTELIGNSSIDVEMMRAEIGELEKTFGAVADERQHTRVELNSQARISVVQAAATPVAPDKSSRIQNSIAACLFGFLAPVGLLLWWDTRGRRVNSRQDISRGLGLPVIGTVPHISDSAMSLKRPTRRQLETQVSLDHSIDGIAAKLCLRRDASNARVVLVSSATRGEGKSTLAIQLAKRLARTGANTLLVDFDLPKPTLHQVFDVPRSPGLSEVLRGEDELSAVVCETNTEHLSVLTAGSPFTDSLGALANGVTRSLFEKVRKEFGFVVVDGSPVLPVVDSLLASQHVDSVVLAIRRDVSQISRVQSACDQLAQFGVEEIVAVLTGSNEDGYYGENDRMDFALTEDRPKPR